MMGGSASASETVPAKLGAPPLKRESLVIVDPHRAVASALGFALQNGTSLVCNQLLCSMREALEELVPARPDLIVVADQLDEHNLGLDLVRAVGAGINGPRWLLFTGVPSPSLIRDAVNFGVASVVARSSPWSELIAAVNAVLAGRTYFCAASSASMLSLVRSPNLQGNLSQTESRILRGLANGSSAKEIACQLKLSVKTVYNGMLAIRTKLRLRNTVELVKFALAQRAIKTKV